MKISKKELTKRKIEYAKKTGNYNYLPSGYGVLNGKIVKTKLSFIKKLQIKSFQSLDLYIGMCYNRLR